MNTASKFTKTEHLEDALKNRAYASPLNNLNDPYEFAGIRYPDEYRVCSFMANNNKMLMWSHYGQGHHGIRIDFYFDDESYHHIEQVQYSKKLQKRQNECTENLKDRILEKGKEWAYEEEKRAVWQKGISDASWCCLDDKIVLRATVNCVVFGTLADSNTEQYRHALTLLKNENSCRDKKSEILVKKCRISDSKYRTIYDKQYDYLKDLERIRL